MGKNSRGVRDGTGSFRDSFRRKSEKKSIGRRREAGIKCPIKK